MSFQQKFQADAGFFESAIETAIFMESSEWKFKALNHIIECLVVLEEFTEALKVAKSSPGRLLNFVDIAAGFLKRGHNIEARNVFAEMLDDESKPKNILQRDHKARALSKIVAVQAQNGRIEDAYSVIKQIKSESYSREEALKEIAIAQVQSGEHNSAKITLEELKQSSEYTADKTVTQIVTYLVDKGSLHDALEFIKYISYSNEEIRAATAIAEAKTGKVTEALINLGENAPKTIGKIAEIALRNDLIEDFQNAKLTFWDPNNVVQTNTWIAHAYIKVGKKSEGEAMLEEALLDSSKVESTVDRQKAMVNIAVVLRYAGQIHTSENIFSKAISEQYRYKSSEFVSPYNADGLSLKMVEELVDIGERVAAFEYAVQIDDVYKQATALLKIAGDPNLEGYSKAVLDLSEIIQIGREGWIPELAEALIKSGDKESFKQLLSSTTNIDFAYEMCGLLAMQYPEYTKELYEVILKGP